MSARFSALREDVRVLSHLSLRVMPQAFVWVLFLWATALVFFVPSRAAECNYVVTKHQVYGGSSNFHVLPDVGTLVHFRSGRSYSRHLSLPTR